MKKKSVFQIAVCAAGLFLLSAVPALGAEGWQQDGSQNWFYMENDKKAVNQWIPWTDGSQRYVGGNGLIVKNNWVNFEGNRYRVKEDGSRYENEWFSIDYQSSQPAAKPGTNWYYAGEGGKVFLNGWYEIGGKYYYFYGGGNSPRKGFLNVEDKRYYVDENGARKEKGWFSIDYVNNKGVTYTNWYYVTDDGSLLKDGWQEAEGSICYFDASGNAYRDRWFDIDGKRSYADKEGKRQNGWFSVTGISGNGQEYTNWYYANPDGTIWRDGWREKDGHWYYFDVNGLNYRKRWYVDKKGERYYLDEEGILQDDGWFKIENTNKNTGVVTESWYYAQESGAVLKNGYKTIGEKKYYFDGNGYNYRKRWMTEGEKRRYLGEDGALKQGEWFSITGIDYRDAEYTNWYYADKNGYLYMDGWYTIDGNRYCFNSGGVMRTGWLTEEADDEEEEDSYYYCKEDGARAAGWKWLEIPESWMDNQDVNDYVHDNSQYAWFYFHESSGRKKRSSGGKKEVGVEGRTYCFDGNGLMYPGWVRISGSDTDIKGYRYFYKPDEEVSSDNRMAAEGGERLYSEGSKKFVFGEKVEGTWLYIYGPDDLNASGNKEWYYFDQTGKPAGGIVDGYEIRKIHGSYYIFDMYGAAKYGLIEVKGEFYYGGEKDGNRKCATGRVMIDDGIGSGRTPYYFDNQGKGITGIKDGYFYYKGRLQKADKGSRYQVFDIPGVGKRLVNASGKVMKNTTVKDGDDQKWEVSAGGQIKVYGSEEIAEIIPPEATESY